jgi:hypothetical protein
MNAPDVENNLANLGDRDLTMWVGQPEGGILHFPTYSYTSLNGDGNRNQFQNIAHKGRHVKWFFVHYGYSKPARKAYVHVKWFEEDQNLVYENVNHYYAPKFWLYVGKDK